MVVRTKPMPIRITEINAKNVGPIREFSLKCADLNLIYGRNEQGKTGLVEFMLKCLFKTGPRSAGKWELRGLGGNGKITVTGLPGGEPRTFSTSKEKLDDIWAESGREMPENISRLLVARGADLALADRHPGGATKTILSKLLSNEDVLSSIQDGIAKNIVKAEITAEEITGPARGEVQAYHDRREQVERIDDLFREAVEARSAGGGEQLRAREQELSEAIDAQERAKRHHAAVLQAEVDSLDERTRGLPDEEINRLRHAIESHIEKHATLTHKTADLESMSRDRTNYEWLRHCRDRYSDYVQVTPKPPGPSWLLVSVAACAAVIACILLEWTLVSLVPFGIAMITGWLHMCAIRRSVTSGVGEGKELEKIRAEYKNRFGEELTNEPQLRQRLDSLAEEQGRATELEGSVKVLQDECTTLEARITQAFQQLLGKPVPSELWADESTQLKRNRDDLEEQRNSAAEQLARLNVSPDQLLEEDPGVEFDSGELERLSKDIAVVKARLGHDEQRLADVKEAIARETGSSPSASFETLLQDLTEKQEQTVNTCRAVAAEIIAGKVVHDVIEESREEEDRSIQEGLACDAVTKTLRAVTGTYNEIGIDGDTLRVSSPSSDYDFADLSTGTQEQVMLALRMGFALRISGGDPMFLILDDAFQHSDWQRREELVDQAISLVEQGWQIFYLTMDDHLRELFRTKSATLGPTRFTETSLG